MVVIAALQSMIDSLVLYFLFLTELDYRAGVAC